MKMIFNYDANKTHFQNKGFALSLVFKVRFLGTQKWPISRTPSSKYGYVASYAEETGKLPGRMVAPLSHLENIGCLL